MLTGAIVGFGAVARHGHWPAYARYADLRVVAVVDRSAARRELARGLDPSLATFDTLAQLLAERCVDVVDICTPPALHAAPMLEAIGHGCHVLCEKPLLLDPAAVAVARLAAEQAGVAVVPVHNWKHAPIVRAATAILRAGEIGRLVRVEIETVRMREAAIADPVHANWRRDPLLAGGGILMDHGWHAVYLALHWFDEPPTRVRAELRRPATGAVEDEAAVSIQFPSGEAAIALTWNGHTRHNRMRLIGTAGDMIVADDVLVLRASRRDAITFSAKLSAGSHHADWFAAMLPEVVPCFHDPARARILFDEAATVLDIVQQAYESDAVLALPRR